MTRLRIGLVSSYELGAPGGVQSQVLGLARHLAARGHEVSVLAPGEAVDVPGAAAGTSTSAGRAVAVPANGSVARVAVAVRPGAVREWSRDLDVVHLHEPLAPGLAPAVLGHAQAPVVVTGHASADGRLLEVAAPVLRQRLARAALLTAVSPHARATLRRVAGPEHDIAIVPNGIDIPLTLVAADPADPVVVAVGRLAEPRKGIDVALAAWPAIRRAHPTARLVLVGPGRPRGLGYRRLPEGVELTGHVEDSGRDSWLDAAHVVLAPHRGGESFGIVVAEAMARGRAVVATDLPAFRDLLAPAPGRWPEAPGAAGVLVRVGDPVGLGEGVDFLLAGPPRRDRVAATARIRAHRFAWDTVADAWLEAYRTALARC